MHRFGGSLVGLSAGRLCPLLSQPMHQQTGLQVAYNELQNALHRENLTFPTIYVYFSPA